MYEGHFLHFQNYNFCYSTCILTASATRPNSTAGDNTFPHHYVVKYDVPESWQCVQGLKLQFVTVHFCKLLFWLHFQNNYLLDTQNQNKSMTLASNHINNYAESHRAHFCEIHIQDYIWLWQKETIWNKKYHPFLNFSPIKIPITKCVAYEDCTTDALDPVTQELSVHSLPNYIIIFSQYYKYSLFSLPSSVCINW